MQYNFLGATDAMFSSHLRNEDVHTYKATASGALIITHRTTAVTQECVLNCKCILYAEQNKKQTTKNVEPLDDKPK